MKLKILSLFVVLLIATSNTVSAADLHAIIVCDTHAIELEDSVKADQKHVLSELKRIAKYTGMKLKITKFSGKNVNPSFLKKIKKLKVQPDDAVIFYWSGHGKRYEWQDDPWPVFDFEYGHKIVSLFTVTQELMTKNPSFILSLADCCNVYDDELNIPLSVKGDEETIRKNYRALFLHSRGTYIAAAALPGEVGIGLDGYDEEIGAPAGGFFTNALINTLRVETAIDNPQINWDVIFDITIAKVIQYQLNDSEDPVVYHHPQYQYLP